jgi:SAM-dependent methyltransferase
MYVDAFVNRRAWDIIGNETDSFRTSVVPQAIQWTAWPDLEPAEPMVGDLAGLDVVELGCGTGEHVAYAAAHGARNVIGVDISPERLSVAEQRFGHMAGTRWICRDAASALAELPALDVVLSVFGALWYSDPDVLLPKIVARLRPGGVLIASVGAPRPLDLPGRRVDHYRSEDGSRLPVIHYVYGPKTWASLLDRHGLTLQHLVVVAGPSGHTTIVFRAQYQQDQRGCGHDQTAGRERSGG